MSEQSRTAPIPVPAGSAGGARGAAPVGRRGADDDKVACDRCGAAMFRMHAVWRCPECGFKTDCCGW